jgi:hypothetical protein
MAKTYRVNAFVRISNYFDVTPDSPLADFEREAPRHRVFRLNTLS